MEPITSFDNVLHQAVMTILEKVEYLDAKLSKIFSPEHEKVIPAWLNVAELQNYLPSHPKKQTIYSWTCTRKIPFHKKGRSIMFNKSEIDVWLQDSEHIKSLDEIERAAQEFVTKKRK